MTYMESIRDWLIILTISFVALFVSVVQPFGVSPDYENYEIFFQEVRDDFWGSTVESRFEPAFIYFSGSMVKILNSNVFVYGLMVFISIALKSYFVNKMSAGYFVLVALVFYLFKIFPLHELTQLRAALAMIFVFGACFFVWNGRPWFGLFLCIPAFFFHYSSLMVFPFLFLPKIEKKLTIGIPIFILIILISVVQFIVIILSQYVSVFQSYENLNYGDEVVNPWSIVLWPEFFMIMFSFVFWRDLTEVMRRVVMLQLIGFAIFYATIQFPVVAVRGREMFSVLWVLFICQGAMTTLRLKMCILMFVLASIILSIYLYLLLDFFH